MISQQLDAAAPAGPTRTRARRRWAWIPAALAVTALSAAACSSTSSSTGPNPATTQADVQKLFNSFFNLAADKSVSGKTAEIQDGSTLTVAAGQALNSSLAASAGGATVHTVTILSDSACAAAKVPSPCAAVKYDILGPGGQVLLPNSSGYAVYVNGKWLVSKTTICGLFGLFYQAEGNTGTPPGCPTS